MNIKDRKLKKPINTLRKYFFLFFSENIFKNLVKISFKAATRRCQGIFSNYADRERLCLQNVSKLVIRDSFFT